MIAVDHTVALDDVQGNSGAGPEDASRVEDLSLKAIGDESSEVVRLVRGQDGAVLAEAWPAALRLLDRLAPERPV